MFKMLTDGRTDDGVTGILIAHLGAFGSGELIITLLGLVRLRIFCLELAKKTFFLAFGLRLNFGPKEEKEASVIIFYYSMKL